MLSYSGLGCVHGQRGKVSFGICCKTATGLLYGAIVANITLKNGPLGPVGTLVALQEAVLLGKGYFGPNFTNRYRDAPNVV